MKKLMSLLLAALLCVMMSVTPVLAETAVTEAPAEEVVEEVAAETEASAEEAETEVETAVEEATEETEAAAEEAVEEVEETKESWVNYAFGKLGEVKAYVWVLLAVLLIFGIALSRNVKWTSRRIAYAAMCIAISFILSLIRLYRMPQGGSITLLSKLPLVMFTMACGPVYGLVAGCAAGLIALIHDPYIIHPIQLLVDYPFASGAVALAALANLIPTKSDKIKLAAGTVLGYLGSYAMAVLSGVVFFAEYAPEGQSALVYSLGYNISYTGPECVIAVLIVLIVPGFGRLVKMIGKK